MHSLAALLASLLSPAPAGPPLHDLPQALHVLAGNDLVAYAAEHQNGRLARDEGHLRCRVPLLVAQERERPEDRERVRHKPRQREESVFENECADLQYVKWEMRERGMCGSGRGRTAWGLRLARSMATAPPMDWPYKTCKNGNHAAVTSEAVYVRCVNERALDARERNQVRTARQSGYLRRQFELNVANPRSNVFRWSQTR